MLVAGVALGCAACGDDAKPSTAGSSGVPATSCLAGVSDEATTVVIKVDDIVSGFGSIGSRSPRPTAGPVRIEVRADAENRGLKDGDWARLASRTGNIRQIPRARHQRWRTQQGDALNTETLIKCR